MQMKWMSAIESIWIINWNFSMYFFTCKVNEINPYIGCELCTHQCECVGTKNSSFTEEQVSRNLRIKNHIPGRYTGSFFINIKSCRHISMAITHSITIQSPHSLIVLQDYDPLFLKVVNQYRCKYKEWFSSSFVYVARNWKYQNKI